MKYILEYRGRQVEADFFAWHMTVEEWEKDEVIKKLQYKDNKLIVVTASNEHWCKMKAKVNSFNKLLEHFIQFRDYNDIETNGLLKLLEDATNLKDKIKEMRG